MKNQSSGRFVVSLILAVVIGLTASGFWSTMSFAASMIYMIVFITPMLSMFLYGFGGILPAAVMLTTLLIGTSYTLGTTWALVMIPAIVIPAAEMIYMSSRGTAFFKQIRYALTTQALGLVAVIVAGYLYFRTDLATVAADYLRNSLDQMPADIQAFIANYLRQFFAQANMELPSEDAELFRFFIGQYEQIMKLSLPTFMVTVTGLNAGLGVLWGNYLRARHGEENVKYVALSGWRLPPSTIIGLTVSMIVTAILQNNGQAEWIMVHSVMLSVVALACLTQASASILSRLRIAGVSTGKRTAFFIAFIVFMNVYLVFYGALSAFIGSRGLITSILKARMEKKRHDKEDM